MAVSYERGAPVSAIKTAEGGVVTDGLRPASDSEPKASSSAWRGGNKVESIGTRDRCASLKTRMYIQQLLKEYTAIPRSYENATP